ncbi:LTA synthase family protein [Mycoavidus sp. SF9855]|uniref:LTA synthase family protein n=1 Tax=Mycoavidus sp. SF9855 TaxID=2968475 RepID=UPI00211B79B5|nr:LTA synthase family protein [Mycoavidus sp. SF9855]UUM22228.1 LTA synthase family protein [Mycoavidus sp. SF9855]
MPTLSFSRAVWAVLILGTLSFTGFRIAQLLSYGDPSLIGQQCKELVRAFWMGARFDFKMLATGLLVCFVLASLIAVPKFSRKIGGYVQRAMVIALFFATNFAAICQYFYYGFYKTPFTPILFGLYEDDTYGVIAAIWSDYPVVWAWLMVIALTWVQTRLTFGWARGAQSVARVTKFCWRAPAVVLITLLALVFFARGQLGKFPLRDQDAVVCANPFINDLVRNAWQTLYDAVKDRRQQIHISTDDPTRQLAVYGFHSLEEVAHTLGAKSGSRQDLEAFIFQRTPTNEFVKAHPPHVVFALMESWGAHQLKFDTAQNNLTGALKKHLERDTLFHNFFSAQLGTHPTLEALLLNSPLTPLTQGSYGFMSYPAAAAKPFKEQGYRTLFLYGGSNAWRSIGRVMKHQYFDEVYDMGNIIERYPDAQRNVWGIYDEYLFHFAYDLLQDSEARGEKVFLFLLTTTNHPPHQTPDHYQPLALELSKMAPHFSADAQNAQKMVWTYQYANHQLGLFLDRISHSALNEKTLVAATGDHNMRALLHYRQPTDSKDLYRVPAYFRVPPAYRPSFKPDPSRYAGHRDIFPSLYHLALSDAVYPHFGDSLFAEVLSQNQYAIVAFESLFSREGALLPFVGRHPSAFDWDVSQTALAASADSTPLLQEQGRQARAWLALADWYTRYQVMQGVQRANAQHRGAKVNE